MTDYRRAFTLIELLVVIAIIALLVTLLVPALQEAKRQAKVIVCTTHLKGFALGLTLYAHEDEGAKYPPHDSSAYGDIHAVWAPYGAYQPSFPDRVAYLEMFKDTICGGTFELLWCPLSYATPLDWPGGGGDQDYPWLYIYNGCWVAGYARYASCVGSVDYTYSGNSRTDGPPMLGGSANDAIVADFIHVESGGGVNYVWDNHLKYGVSQSFEDAVQGRTENNVGYGDGHVEIHAQKGYIDSSGWFTWDDAHYVGRAGFIRYQY